MPLEQAEPIFDYKVVSDGTQTRPRWTETVWVFVTKKKHGPELGTVEIVEDPQTGDFRATFDLSGFDPIEVVGPVPGGNWTGMEDGTAKRTGRPDKRIKVECWNPKGWG